MLESRGFSRIAFPAPAPGGIGHNTGATTIVIEVRLFNSLVRHAGPNGPVQRLRDRA